MAPARRKPGDGFFGHKPNHKNGGRPSPGNFLPKQKSGRAALNVRPSLFSGPPWPAGHAGAAMSAPARVPLAAIPT